MDTYKFDWKEEIHGSLEIQAENGIQAEEKFKEMSVNELLKRSQTGSDGNTRAIKFVDAGIHFQSLSKEEWNKIKKNF